MKLLKYIMLLTLFLTGISNAACLEGLSGSDSINSKIRGFYLNPTNTQYVILDKANCSAFGGNTALANGTITHYYLEFDSTNTFLASSLLTAYAKGELVEFRVGGITGSYNKIAYIILPAGSRVQ